MKKLRDFIVEDKKEKKEETPKKYKFGCVMLFLNPENWKSIEIDKDDLYITEDDNFGMEEEPHITALFGIHPEEVDSSTVIETAMNNMGGQVPIIIATEISIFDNPDYDVLKYDVEVTPELVSLNEALKKLPFTNDYPDYHPHITIAYLKKGLGRKYAKVLEEPKTDYPTHLVYSQPNDAGDGTDKKTVKLYVSKDAEKDADI